MKQDDDYSDYSEYSVSKMNIRPLFSLFKFFFLRNKMKIIPIIMHSRFLKRIFDRIIRSFNFLSKKKHNENSDYSEYSVSKTKIWPNIQFIQIFFLRYKMTIIPIIPNIRFLKRIFDRILSLFNFFFYETR